MWSLPNINEMNARKAASATKLADEAKGKGVDFTCDCCSQPATEHLPYYDIFSNDISGVSHLCQKHYEDGTGDEDTFICACCERRMLDHITLERYGVEIDGEIQCLACAAKNYFADEDNAIDPKLVKAVAQDPKTQRKLWDAKTGTVNLCGVKHVLGVKQPLPPGVKFVDNYENCNERGLFPCADILEAIQKSDKPVYLVLDGAYQFSASVGLYVKE